MAVFAITPRGDVVLMLTPAEASALHSCANDGAARLLTVPPLARTFIGPAMSQSAAKRALTTLGDAAHTSRIRQP